VFFSFFLHGKYKIFEGLDLMDSRMELIQHAIDTNVFKSTDTSAGYINPAYWNRQVLHNVESALVITQAAKVYDDLLGTDGTTLNITVGVEPTAASALVETTAVTIDAFTYTQVQFSPTEYGAAYQITDKESRRSFFSLMGDVTQKLGYRLARKREAFAENLLRTGAGTAIVANNVFSSAIVSSDALDYVDVVNARTKIKVNKFSTEGALLFVHPYQAGSLLKDTQFSNAYQYGGREAVLNGAIGRIAGCTVIEADEIVNATSKSKAILVGRHRDGTPAFGIARKCLPRIETDRRAVDRVTDVVASEEWDMKILYAGAICTIESYAA
jgi:N4-gp56 family major capsid protein